MNLGSSFSFGLSIGLLALTLADPARAQQPAPAPAPAPDQPAPPPMAVPSIPPPPGARVLGLFECVDEALAHNVDARTSEVEVDAAGASRAGVRGQLGPKLRAEGNALQWNSAFDVVFAPPGTPGPTPPITVRDAFTWSATVSLIQPVTPLFTTLHQLEVESAGVDVAKIRRDVTRRDVAYAAGAYYFRLLQARGLAEVAIASVTQLEAQRAQAQSLYDHGVIGRNDLLRAELALASAKQRAIQTRGQVEISRSQLAVAMGLPADAAIDARPISIEPPPIDEPSLATAEAHAATQRFELREVDRRIEQSDASVAAARDKLLPQVNLVGSYQHNEGSAFAQKNAAYVGLVGTWDVWDWGTTTSGISAAEARREQAKLARQKIEEQIRLEARQAFVDATSAQQAFAVARTAVAQAEENFRIVTRRFQQNVATSFDVVDAEAVLTQARAQVQNALYDYLVARGMLQRATGSPLPHR